MTFDNEKQKKIILQLLDAATFTGKSLDEIYEFKKQVNEAQIKEKKGLNDLNE